LRFVVKFFTKSDENLKIILKPPDFRHETVALVCAGFPTAGSAGKATSGDTRTRASGLAIRPSSLEADPGED